MTNFKQNFKQKKVALEYAYLCANDKNPEKIVEDASIFLEYFAASSRHISSSAQNQDSEPEEK